MKWKTPKAFCLFLILVAAVGCDTRPGATSRSSDSAGVAIILSEQPSWSANEGWRIDSIPVAALDAAPDSTQVTEIAGVLLFPSGRFVVGDESDNTIHFYDAAGKQLSKAGRKGEGPGEFADLSRFRADGDSLLVWDSNRSRISVYDHNGAFRGTQLVQLAKTYSSPSPDGRWADGRWLFVEGSTVSSTQRTGMARATMAAIRMDSLALGDTVLGRWPGSEQMAITSTQIVADLDLPYAKRTTIRWTPNGFCVGTSDQARIDCHDETGKLVRSIRWAAAPMPVPPSEVRAWREKGIEAWRGEKSAFAAAFSAPFIDAYEKATFPEFRPAYRTFIVDDTGGLWVRRIPRWDEADRPEVWDILDASGQWLGSVSMPARVALRGVAGRRVIGVWLDGDDVNHVRVYSIDGGQ